MGLDTVELIMDIEEAFDITIPDDRASRMLTVGDVYDFILEQTAGVPTKTDTCLTAATFYELRRHIRSIGLSTAEFRPKSKLNQAIPFVGRRAYWRELGSRMQLRFPSLCRPSWLSLLNVLIVVTLSFASLLFLALGNTVTGLAVTAGLCVLSAVVLSVLTRPLAIYPPSTCTTIGDLITNIVATNYTILSVRYSTRSPSDIWNALQFIVSEQLGVDQNAVVPNARFVQDLGAD